MKTKSTPIKCPVCEGSGKIETKECHSCKGAGILYMTETDFSTPIEISPYINPLPLVNPYPLYNPYIYTTWTTNSSISLFY